MEVGVGGGPYPGVHLPPSDADTYHLPPPTLVVVGFVKKKIFVKNATFFRKKKKLGSDWGGWQDFFVLSRDFRVPNRQFPACRRSRGTSTGFLNSFMFFKEVI